MQTYRRMPNLAFFDNQGTLDSRESHSGSGLGRRALSAPSFVGKLYDLIGRPFKPSKHLPSAVRQVHLGLLNVLEDFHKNELRLEPKEGKIQ